MWKPKLRGNALQRIRQTDLIMSGNPRRMTRLRHRRAGSSGCESRINFTDREQQKSAQSCHRAARLEFLGSFDRQSSGSRAGLVCRRSDVGLRRSMSPIGPFRQISQRKKMSAFRVRNGSRCRMGQTTQMIAATPRYAEKRISRHCADVADQASMTRNGHWGAVKHPRCEQ
jgi:hypothetical protein